MIIYEDAAVRARIVEVGAAVGHVIVEPVQDVHYLNELSEDEAIHLWYLASYAATAVFEGLGAQGTNLVLNEGDGEKLQIHVLPRSPDDGIDLYWHPERADPQALESAEATVKDALWAVGKGQDVSPTHVVAPPLPSDAFDDEVTTVNEDDYRVKQLKRYM